MRFLEKEAFFYRGYAQGFFFLALTHYALFFPPGDTFERIWPDTLMDTVGIGAVVLGELLRIWAVSHAGKCTRSRRLKASMLITSGPYAYVRNPIYLGNFLIGLGMVILSEALVFIPVFLVLFALQYSTIVSEEERLLSERFGEEFERYRSRVPKYFPQGIHMSSKLTFGKNLPLKEFGTAGGIIIGVFFFEWIESPLHRQWILSLYHWLI